MIQINNKILIKDTINLISKNIEKNKTIIIDIETTGFSPTYNYIFLIGCIYYCKGNYYIIQWLCEKEEDEYELLFTFNKFIKDFNFIIHYNGNSFDIPFIEKRMKFYNINNNFKRFEQLDLYNVLRPYKELLGLENLKLKTVEKYCKYDREDSLDGSALIKKYKEYLITKENLLKEELLLHNYDDLLGLYATLDIYKTINKINHLHNKNIIIEEFLATKTENRIYCKLTYNSSLNLNIKSELYNIEINDSYINLEIPLYLGSLKLFFSNYKDYYYLPLEEIAIHKSVSKYVDKNYRKKATKENCYIKKRGTFIPLYSTMNTNYKTFKETYSDEINYIELLDDRSFLEELCLDILSHEIGSILS